MQVTYNDIIQRIRRKNLRDYTKSASYLREAQLYTPDNTFCENNAITSIIYWESLADDIDSAYVKALDIFSEICANSNQNIIKESGRILLENVDKVRDQVQLANSLKYRMALLKKKTATKLNKRYDVVNNAIKGAITNFNNSLPKPGQSAGVSSVSTDHSSNNTKEDTEGVAQECYTRIYDRCMVMKECDRIIKNYNSISKIFNIDKIVSNINNNRGLYEACYEIAQCVDTYNVPFINKYNTALETASYAFDKHFMNCPKSDIIQAITDYFIFSGGLKESSVQDINRLSKISVLYDESDFNILPWREAEFVNEEYAEETVNELTESYGVDPILITESSKEKREKKRERDKKKAAIKKDFKISGRKLIKDAKKGNPEERTNQEVQEMIDDFRKNCMKDEDDESKASHLKELVRKLFSKSTEQIVFGLPKILSLCTIFVITIVSINVSAILAILILIISGLTSHALNRKQSTKALKAYENEIKAVKDKIEKAKDEESKKRLEEYLKKLECDHEKMEEYVRNIHSEEENDERDAAKWAEDDDDDFDFDFGDDDFNFDEAAAAICISNYMESINEALVDNSIEGIINANICRLDNDSIDALTDFSITVPTILEKGVLKKCLIKHRQDLRESNNIMDYIRIDCINENVLKLDRSSSAYNTYTSPRDSMMCLACLNEITNIKSPGYLNEMDFSNTIKLAINNLKKTAVKLTDKEKQVSNNIDVAASNVAKSLEQGMMNGNREAVIRGSMIPSASKCIKIALTTRVAWAVSPAIAIIGAIGSFACAKHLQAKERQLILDDIDIELKMCERYMRQAEDEGDMKKIRQIEQIQRNLERQKQRISYKMVTVYNQKVPKTGNND